MLQELQAIVDIPEEATFANTIKMFDRAGAVFNTVAAIFSNLCGSACGPALQAVQLEMAAPLAAHEAKVATFPGLFKKIDQIYQCRTTSDLTPVQIRLVERFHLDFVRAGALFDVPAQARYNAVMQQLAELTTTFTQNVLADESEIVVSLTLADLTGCPADIIASARAAAVLRNVEVAADVYVINLGRSMVVPLLTYASSRVVRERVWRAWTSRGELSPSRDNNSVAVQILALRAEQARAHNHRNFSEYQTSDTMAGTPAAVSGLLQRVWAPAKV